MQKVFAHFESVNVSHYRGSVQFDKLLF